MYGAEHTERFDSFFRRVGGDDIKLGGFNNQFAGRDASRKLPVNDQETRSHHSPYDTSTLYAGRATGWTCAIGLARVVRAERFELPTFWFVARRSIQLSYARMCVPH